MNSKNNIRQREPLIRVGVILPEDKISEIDIEISETSEYLLYSNNQSYKIKKRLLHFSTSGTMISSSMSVKSTEWSIEPLKKISVQPGSGIKVMGVRVGRNFHWQKEIDVYLPGIIKLSLIDGNMLLINNIYLEEYLMCVATSEMSAECPLELIEAQTIAARSWILSNVGHKHSSLNIDVCNDDCCQRYMGTGQLTQRAIEASQLTRGQVLVDQEGRLIDANYSKNCGGIIESPQHVWSVTKPGQRAAPDAPPGSPARDFFPLTADKLDEYLTGSWLAETDVFCSPNVVPEQELPWYLSKVDEGGGRFRWTVEYNREDLEQVLKAKFFAR